MLTTIASYFKSTLEPTSAELEAASTRRLVEFKLEYHVLIETMCLHLMKKPSNFSLVLHSPISSNNDNGSAALPYFKLFDLVFDVDKYCIEDKTGYLVIDYSVRDYIIELFRYYLPDNHRYWIKNTNNYDRLSACRSNIVLTCHVRFDPCDKVTPSKYEVDLEIKNRDTFVSKLIDDNWENIIVACQKFCVDFSQPNEKSELFVFDIDCAMYATHDKSGCDHIIAIVCDAIYNLLAKSLGTKTFKITNAIDKGGNMARCYCYGEKNVEAAL